MRRMVECPESGCVAVESDSDKYLEIFLYQGGVESMFRPLTEREYAALDPEDM